MIQLIRNSWVIALVLTASSLRAQGALIVHARADQTTYSFREPIRLTVTITNESAETVQIPQVSRLESDEMEFIYFDVRSAGGFVRRAKSVRLSVNSIDNSEYSGAPLASGDSVEFFCYPIGTNRLVSATGEIAGRADTYRTFPGPGVYQLRVVLHTVPAYPRLFSANGASFTWSSRPLTIEIRKPDQTEERILDALWKCDPEGEDGIALRRGDLGKLRTVISDYPAHPLTRHCRYALGRLIFAQSVEGKARPLEAAKVLSDLIDEHPEFRHEEASLFLVRSYRDEGRQEAAFAILSELMEERPSLWTNWPFVVLASTLTPDPQRSLESWKQRELREGAKPVPISDLSNVWSEQ